MFLGRGLFWCVQDMAGSSADHTNQGRRSERLKEKFIASPTKQSGTTAEMIDDSCASLGIWLRSSP